MIYRALLLIAGISLGISANAQYWFGLKGGGHFVDFDYQSRDYADSFAISPNVGYQIGAMGTYTASKRYSVHLELNYEFVRKTVKGVDTEFIKTADLCKDGGNCSKSKYHYLSLPVMLEVNFGKEPFMFYVNGGPKINVWLGSQGTVSLTEFDEFLAGEPQDYKMVYLQSRAVGSDLHLAMTEPNILQFGVAIGAGAHFDIYDVGRVMLDVRYNFGHSNLGFNGSPDFSNWESYYENFEYRHHILSISLGYAIPFNAQLQRKGKSTNRNSN
ncbi:MAG: PorT family protein [Cyclobacteriaceae bacterium]